MEYNYIQKIQWLTKSLCDELKAIWAEIKILSNPDFQEIDYKCK